MDGKVFIDNKPLDLPEKAKPQYSYKVKGKGLGFNPRVLLKNYDITDGVYVTNNSAENKEYLFSALTDKSAQRLSKHQNVAQIEKEIIPKGKGSKGIFPNNGKVDWNRDQMGPIYIPEAGKTIDLTLENIDFYKRIIETYEGEEMGAEAKVSINGNQILINGAPTSKYTFKQNYYWMMGDNRHNLSLIHI